MSIRTWSLGHGFREWAPPEHAVDNAGNPAPAPALVAGAGPAAALPAPNAAAVPNNNDHDDAQARNDAPSLPPLNLLATIQASPHEADDVDDAEPRQACPKHLPQREITKQIMQHKHAQAPEAPWTRGRQMLALRHKRFVPTLGPEDGPGVNDLSILQSVMPHQVADNDAAAGEADGANAAAGAGDAGNAPKRQMLTHACSSSMHDRRPHVLDVDAAPPRKG